MFGHTSTLAGSGAGHSSTAFQLVSEDRVPTSEGHASPIERELFGELFTPVAKCCQEKNALSISRRKELAGLAGECFQIVTGICY